MFGFQHFSPCVECLSFKSSHFDVKIQSRRPFSISSRRNSKLLRHSLSEMGRFQNLSMSPKRGHRKTSSFAPCLRHTRVFVLEILEVCLWVKPSRFLTCSKTESPAKEYTLVQWTIQDHNRNIYRPIFLQVQFCHKTAWPAFTYS